MSNHSKYMRKFTDHELLFRLQPNSDRTPLLRLLANQNQDAVLAAEYSDFALRLGATVEVRFDRIRKQWLAKSNLMEIRREKSMQRL